MTQSHSVQCTNCGATWNVDVAETPLASSLEGQSICPVCQYVCTLKREIVPYLSRDELEQQLSSLITLARASGLDTKTIMLALSEELGFAAEMEYKGRQFHVQVIDLGFNEGAIMHRSNHYERKGFLNGQREQLS